MIGILKKSITRSTFLLSACFLVLSGCFRSTSNDSVRSDNKRHVLLRDIPKEGMITDEFVVIPGDTVRAFNPVCPHQGCLVKSIRDEKIICPCHQSIFSTVDGSRISGPARKGLRVLNAETQGEEVIIYL